MIRRPDNAQALEAFIARKMEIDAMLDRLGALSEEHFEVDPDKVNWGHVGTLAHYADLLKRVTDGAFQETNTPPDDHAFSLPPRVALSDRGLGQ